MRKFFLNILIFISFFFPLVSHATIRNWNSNTEIVGDKKVTEFHSKWVNWLDISGFQPIDTRFSTTTIGFSMLNAPFRVALPLRSTGIAVFYNDNRFDPFSHTQIIDPVMWMSIQAQGVNDVAGVLMQGDLMTDHGLQKNVSYVVYPNAYPSGADLIYYVHFGVSPKLQKLIRFKSSTEFFSPAIFRLQYSQDPIIRVTNDIASSTWDKISTLSLQGEVLNAKITEKRGIGFENFLIWDSNIAFHQQKVESIQVQISKVISGYLLIKNLPRAPPDWVYPIYTDTTTNFFPNSPGDANGRDGWSARVAGGSTFASLRGGAGTHTGTASPVEAFDILADASGNTWKQMRTSFFLFDTSSIGSGQTVSSATFGLVGATGGGDTGNLSQSAVMVDSNPANPIAASSFEGRLGVEQATGRIAVSSWNTDGTTYNTFTLNSTGIGNISVTGTSKFGIRGSGDFDNTEPTWAANANGSVVAKYADTAGTTADPKLAVTYAATVSAVKRKVIFVQ